MKALVLSLLAVGVSLSVLQGVTAAAQNCLVDPAARKSCGSIFGVNNEACLAAGCCWARSPLSSSAEPDVSEAELSVTPWCFQGSESLDVGYALDTASLAQTEFGITGQLTRNLPTNPVYGDDISTLSFELFYETQSRVRVRITDAVNARWEIPQTVIERPQGEQISMDQSDMSVSIVSANPFSFEIKRKSDGITLFKSSEQLVFKDQYIELTSEFANVQNSSLRVSTFGIGENTRTHLRQHANNSFTLWAADVMALKKNANLYSSYPYYLQKIGDGGNTHGVLMMNR
jgi:alpha-glucosidase (family GH31 glycosyl hydrolase)